MKDSQVCLYAMQSLLTNTKVLEIVKDFSSNTASMHWKSSKSYEYHINFHKVGDFYICGGRALSINLVAGLGWSILSY